MTADELQCVCPEVRLIPATEADRGAVWISPAPPA